MGDRSMAKRLLLQSVSKNRVVYACSAWAVLVVKFAYIHALMMRTQLCIVLMVIRGYRAVSGATAMILVVTVPQGLMILEKRAIHELGRGTRNRAAHAQQLREESLRVWQRMDKEDFPKYF